MYILHHELIKTIEFFKMQSVRLLDPAASVLILEGKNAPFVESVTNFATYFGSKISTDAGMVQGLTY